MHVSRKVAIPVLSIAALAGSGGIAYANAYPTPSVTPTNPIVTPSPTPTIPTPLPFGCYRATDHEFVTAPGHRPVVENVQAIVCRFRFGQPVVFVDTNAFPFGPFGR